MRSAAPNDEDEEHPAQERHAERGAGRRVARAVGEVVDAPVAGEAPLDPGEDGSTPTTTSGNSTPPQNGFGISV